MISQVSRPMRPYRLGATAAAQVRLIVWCRDCQHRVEPDPAEQGRAMAPRPWSAPRRFPPGAIKRAAIPISSGDGERAAVAAYAD
jgi:hypothetical protein